MVTSHMGAVMRVNPAWRAMTRSKVSLKATASAELEPPFW